MHDVVAHLGQVAQEGAPSAPPAPPGWPGARWGSARRSRSPPASRQRAARSTKATLDASGSRWNIDSPVKHRPTAHAVEPAHQLPAVPHLDAVGPAQGVELDVGVQHLGGDPRPPVGRTVGAGADHHLEGGVDRRRPTAPAQALPERAGDAQRPSRPTAGRGGRARTTAGPGRRGATGRRRGGRRRPASRRRGRRRSRRAPEASALAGFSRMRPTRGTGAHAARSRAGRPAARHRQPAPVRRRAQRGQVDGPHRERLAHLGEDARRGTRAGRWRR